ncbi:hypothetical protein Peur_058562 [Populus x canadensis]
MGSKKKKAGSHRSRLQQQKLLENFRLNDSAILALAAPPPTVHATVPSNSNSKQCPPGSSPDVCSLPNPRTLSPPHSSPPHHGDHNINHIFVEDWSDEDALEDEEVDFTSSVEDYVGAPTLLTSTVVGASPPGGQAAPVASLAVVQPSPPPLSPAAGSIPPSGCRASTGAQPTPPPLSPAEKITSPHPAKPSSLLPGCCESSPSTVAVPVAPGNVASRLGPRPPIPSQAQDIPASQGAVGSPVDPVAATDWVTVVSRRKSNNRDKGKAVAVSELGPASPVGLGPVCPSSAPPLVATSCAEEPPSSNEPLVMPACVGEGHNPSPTNPLAITSAEGNMADKPVSPPIVEGLAKSRARNRTHSGPSSRPSPPVANKS